MSLNLIHVLHNTFGIPKQDIGAGIEQRAAQQVDAREIECWLEEQTQLADWVHRAAALWIIELWMNERDACEAERLLKVDEKYTRFLRDYNMGQIINMRNAIIQA